MPLTALGQYTIVIGIITVVRGSFFIEGEESQYLKKQVGSQKTQSGVPPKKQKEPAP